jgi:hypothetical protein
VFWWADDEFVGGDWGREVVGVVTGSDDGKGEEGNGYGGYGFEVQPVMFVSAAVLVCGLLVTLGYAFGNRWRLDRRLAVVLWGLWAVGMVCSVVVTVKLSWW